MNVRSPSMDEAAAATEVLNSHSRALHGVDDLTSPELEEAWTAPEVDFPDDVFVAELDGRLVGYADVIPFGETSWVDVRATDPRAYDPLLEAATSRAEQHSTRYIRAFANDRDTAAGGAIERAGYGPIRYGFRMAIDLEGDALAEPEWPEGFTVRPFREGDAPSFYRGHQESFADTWEFTSEPFEPWQHWFMGNAFQPEHWFLVEREGDLAAIAICRIPEVEQDTGFVRLIGVLPKYRRRGLALALLRHIFRHFAARGMKKVQLGVDGENPTGAVALYERAGMSVLRRNVTFERVPG